MAPTAPCESPLDSYPDEARCVKSRPSGKAGSCTGNLVRQRTQIAVAVDRLGQTADLLGADRLAAKSRLPLQKSLDLSLALLGLQRAGAVDQPAAGLRQLRRGVEEARLQGG